MTYAGFVQQVQNQTELFPESWRLGQKIFNAVEALFEGLGRDVQFGDGIDCFYDDNQIGNFLTAAYDRLAAQNSECEKRTVQVA